MQLASRRLPLGLAVLALLGGSGSLAAAAPPSAADTTRAADVVELLVLSGRADLVTNGDAYVRAVVPQGAKAGDLRLEVGGRDVTAAFAPRDGGFEGVVKGLALGPNVLTARLPDGNGARILLQSSPIGGPVFSGPQVQPWTCFEGAEDDKCNREPSYDFFYKSTQGGGLQAYDPENPPSDVATTTTDQGSEVPFVVRQETGVSMRDEYRIAVLFDPTKPWDPTAPQPGYNSKLVLTHGASCDISFAQAAAPDVLNETALGKGFAVASHALDNAGHNCNLVTQAESLLVTKELVAERYGPIRYTIGSGCSGGALAQQHLANAYPGLYQGITPACSFTDSWSSTMQREDYTLMRRYFEDPTTWSPDAAWNPVAIGRAYGHPNPGNAVAYTEVIKSTRDPSRACPGLEPDQVYDPEVNPDGVRCTLQDFMVNVFGERPQDGFAGNPLDNTGIQYGLAGLRDGALTPAQFVDLNVKIGGRDIDYEYQQQRREADRPALERVYRSGAVNTGAHMDEVAIIDLRGPDPGAFHDVYRTYAMRERLIREHGTADNQVLWRGQQPIFADTTFTDTSILAMDSWLAVIEQDTRDLPLAQKVLDARKVAGIEPRCTDGTGTDVPASVCDGTVQSYGTPRFEAGMPPADDTMKCQLVPMDRASYDATFSDAQWEALVATFPNGVCDYSKPSVGEQDAVTWLTYANTVGGRPMGPAPVSVPFGPGAVGAPSAAPGAASGALPATGRGLLLPSAAAALLVGAWLARRREQVARAR